MLQPANVSQQQQLTPQDYLVSQGKMKAQNPDNTTPAERTALVQRFYKESQNSQARQDAEKYWREADRFVKGMHWSESEGMGGYHQEFQFVINKIYSIKEKLVSLLIENLPEVEFLERQQNETEIATAIDNFYRHEWERNNWMYTLGLVLEEAIKHRTGFVKVYWDNNADGGRGAVRLEAISNYNLFLHEDAMIRDGQLASKYIIHRMDKTKNEIVGQWKVDPSGQFQKDMGLQKPNSNKKKPMLDMMREESSIMRGGSASTSRPPDHKEKKESFEVLECHYQDDSLIKSAGINESESARLQYPSGRVLTECNGHVLYDKPNIAGFCMFVPLTTEPSIDSIYGPSILNQLSGIQMALNKGYSQVVEHTERCSNPILRITSSTIGLNQDSDLGKPGSRVIVLNDQQEGISYVQAASLGKEVMEVIVMSSDSLEDVSGVYEVSQGDTSPQARSGIAIERLQAAALTRSNLRSVYLDQGLKTLARNICSLFLDFVSQDRQFRFFDEETQQEAYGTFNAEAMILPKRRDRIMQIKQQIGMERTKVFQALRLAPPERAAEIEQYQMQVMQMLEQEIIQVMTMPAHDLVSFDVRIQTGSRSMTKSQKHSNAIMLFELGVFTEADLLKALEIPNARKILGHKAEEHQAQAEAQAEANQEMIAIENRRLEMEHDNALELQETKGILDLVIERLDSETQIEVAEIRERGAQKRASASSS